MDHFQRRDGELWAEDVRLADIAARVGTPTYVYSRATITRHVRVLTDAMAGVPHLLCYAIKANGNQALLELLQSLGCGLDAVSVGELARALKAGAPPNTVITSGVGKRDDEIEAALRAGVLYLSVESAEELVAVNTIAARLGVVAPVSIRVNPDVDAKTHPYIATGLRENKFGVPMGDAEALYRRGLSMAHVRLCGLTCHIGSQIVTLDPFVDAARRMVSLARVLLSAGVPLEHLGVGGGLGIPYANETPPAPAAYGAALAEVMSPLGLHLVLEPGRVIVGNAGVLLTRVVRTKPGPTNRFLLLDAGMNDLIRPALYEAHHAIEPVGVRKARTQSYEVVGPVCESADTFAHNRVLPELDTGDLLAIRSAGAYGFVMSSTYNGRPRAAEVLVDGERLLLIRQREALSALWRGETTLGGAAVDDSLPWPISASARKD